MAIILSQGHNIVSDKYNLSIIIPLKDYNHEGCNQHIFQMHLCQRYDNRWIYPVNYYVLSSTIESITITSGDGYTFLYCSWRYSRNCLIKKWKSTILKRLIESWYLPLDLQPTTNPWSGGLSMLTRVWKNVWRPMETFRACFWSNLLQKAFHAIERYCPETRYKFKDTLFRYIVFMRSYYIKVESLNISIVW